MTDIISSRGPPPAPPPHALSFAEDSATEYFSEVDTALNTPTSWTTEHVPTPQLNSRWSLSSSWSSTFSRPTSIHNNNHNTNKRNSEFFIPRRSLSPKNMNDRAHNRTSLPPNSISTPVPTSGGGKLFSKLAAFSHISTANSTTNDVIQEEGQQNRRGKRQKQQSSQPQINHNNQHHHHHHHNDQHDHHHTSNYSNHHYDNNSSSKINSSQQQQHQHQQQQQQQQQQYRMHPHESIRVQRLLSMVYQFQQTSPSSSSKANNNNHSSIEGHNDDQAFSAFCTQLQTYLESWADLKQGKRHVVRQTKTTILRNQRTSSIRSKRQKRNIADRPSYRQNNYQQKQNSQLSDSDSDSDDNYDNDEDDEFESANIQQKSNTSHEKLLSRINDLEKALETSKYDKNQVEQKLNAVQDEFPVARQQPEISLQEQDCIDDAQRPLINVDNVDELQKNDITSSPSDNDNIEQRRLVEENNTLRKAIEQQEQSYQEVCTMLTQTQATITELELKLQTANNSLAEKEHITCDCEQTIIAERNIKIQDLEATLQQLLAEQQGWEQQAAKKYFHEKETFKVQISREVRELAGTLAEQESQMDVLEKRRQQDALTINRIEAKKRAAEQKCQKRLDDWEAEEKKLRMTVATLEAKVVKLEQDTLVLYSKNLKLAHQLGQWAP